MRGDREWEPPCRALVDSRLDEDGEGVYDIREGKDREHDQDLDAQAAALRRLDSAHGPSDRAARALEAEAVER